MVLISAISTKNLAHGLYVESIIEILESSDVGYEAFVSSRSPVSDAFFESLLMHSLNPMTAESPARCASLYEIKD